MRVLAVVPAFNEQDSLAKTIGELTATCPEVDYLVVNDGSADGTQDLIEREGYNALCLPVNTGLTSAFKAGMKYALAHDYDAVVQFDADGQHVPTYIMPMAEAMKREQANIVIASRLVDGSSLSGARGVGSKLISWLIKVTTGTLITDPTSGMRMYDREIIRMYAKSFDLAPEPDAIAMLMRKGYKVVEIPCTMREREAGESYLRMGAVVRYMSRTCLSIMLFQWFR